MKKRAAFLVLALLLGLCGLSGCGNQGGGSEYEIGRWERQSPKFTATLEALTDRSPEYFEGLDLQYVKFTFELDAFDRAKDGIYYNNRLRSAYTDLKSGEYDIVIFAYSYQNYWELPLELGDRVTVDGYCRIDIREPYYSEGELKSAGRIYVYVDPCYAVKA